MFVYMKCFHYFDHMNSPVKYVVSLAGHCVFLTVLDQHKSGYYFSHTVYNQRMVRSTTYRLYLISPDDEANYGLGGCKADRMS